MKIPEEKGLSNKTVTAIEQDRSGFIWFGTQSGLNRYDGYSMKVFRRVEGDPFSLSCDRVSRILIDSSGQMWVCTNGGGICLYRPATEDFERIFPDRKHPDSLANIVLSAVEEKDGVLWFGTWGEGLYRYQVSTGEFRQFKLGGIPNPDFQNKVLTVLKDRNDRIWMGTRSGLFRFRKTSLDFVRIGFREGCGIADGIFSVPSIYESKRGELWVGTHHGLFMLDERKGELVPAPYRWARELEDIRILKIIEDPWDRMWVASWNGVHEIDSSRSQSRVYTDTGLPDRVLSSSIVTDIFRDSSGIIWVGTFQGVNYFDGNRRGFRNYDLRDQLPRGIRSFLFSAIYPDPDGTLWLGTMRNGVIHLDREQGLIQNIRESKGKNHSIAGNVIMNIKGGRRGDLYISTTRGFTVFNRNMGTFRSFSHDPGDPGSISHNEVISIQEIEGGDLLLGTMNGLNRLDLETGRAERFFHDPNDPESISGNLISFSVTDRKGRVWVGSYGGGLNRFFPETGRFQQIHEDPRGGNRRKFIYPGLVSKEGKLWMGSREAGLKMFDPDTLEFTNFTMRDGLASNTVYDVMEDDEGYLWFSTSAGISRMDKQEFVITNFGKSDGILIDFFYFNSGFHSSDGEFFFSGEKGFISFFPGDISDPVAPPPVVVTSVRKSGPRGEEVIPGCRAEGFKFYPGDRGLTFEFASLSYLYSSANRYRYRLEGMDARWRDIGGERSVTFGHLRPGKYIFTVLGSNSRGDWSRSGASVSFRVIPSFWQTWWFTTLWIFFVLAGVIVFYRYKVRAIERRLRDESDMEKLFRKKKISKREREILLLVIRGLTSREIEDKLFISYGTVKNHIYSIYKKLNVKNRAEIVNLFKDIKNI